MRQNLLLGEDVEHVPEVVAAGHAKHQRQRNMTETRQNAVPVPREGARQGDQQLVFERCQHVTHVLGPAIEELTGSLALRSGSLACRIHMFTLLGRRSDHVLFDRVLRAGARLLGSMLGAVLSLKDVSILVVGGVQAGTRGGRWDVLASLFFLFIRCLLLSSRSLKGDPPGLLNGEGGVCACRALGLPLRRSLGVVRLRLGQVLDILGCFLQEVKFALFLPKL